MNVSQCSRWLKVINTISVARTVKQSPWPGDLYLTLPCLWAEVIEQSFLQCLLSQFKPSSQTHPSEAAINMMQTLVRKIMIQTVRSGAGWEDNCNSVTTSASWLNSQHRATGDTWKYELTPAAFSLFSQYCLSCKSFNSLSAAIFLFNVAAHQVGFIITIV